MEKDNVIWTKFAQKLAEKRGLSKLNDIKIPISNQDGKPFDSYYTTEISETETALYGVKNDRSTELIGIDKTPQANLMAKILNSGGFFNVSEVHQILKQ